MAILLTVLGLGYVPLAIALSWIDMREHRLPNRLVLALAGWVAVCSLGASFVPELRSAVLWAVLIGLAAGAVGILIALVGPQLLGMGDAKVLAPVVVTAALPGWDALAAGAVGLAVLGGAAGCAAAIRAGSLRARFAYGPLLLCMPVIGILGAPLVRDALGTTI